MTCPSTEAWWWQHHQAVGCFSVAGKERLVRVETTAEQGKLQRYPAFLKKKKHSGGPQTGGKDSPCNRTMTLSPEPRQNRSGLGENVRVLKWPGRVDGHKGAAANPKSAKLVLFYVKRIISPFLSFLKQIYKLNLLGLCASSCIMCELQRNKMWWGLNTFWAHCVQMWHPDLPNQDAD